MKLSNKETARQAIELLDLRHEPAVELYTKKSMAYMLNHPPFDINSYKNIHAPKFFSAFPDLIHNIEMFENLLFSKILSRRNPTLGMPRP